MAVDEKEVEVEKIRETPIMVVEEKGHQHDNRRAEIKEKIYLWKQGGSRISNLVGNQITKEKS